ncbi:MAG: DUF3617 family protein [Luteitalea sp.]|nr:DUF3617 family protein [Luteitalea sp.]
MKLMVAVGLVGAVAFCSSMAAQGEGPRRDGNWQVTVEMDMPGMPQRMPPMTVTQCVTKADAADPTRTIPQGQGPGAMPDTCKTTNVKTVGDKVSWSMQCAGQNPFTGDAEFVYSRDTYTGTMKMNMDRGGQPVVMAMKYNGKRLGDCER